MTNVRDGRAGGKSLRQPARPMECRICGCDELHACKPFGCCWILRQPAAVCSACIFFLANARNETIAAAVCKAAGLPIITRRQAGEVLGRNMVNLELLGSMLAVGGNA